MKNLIKLPDEDRYAYHYFCKYCNFWFAEQYSKGYYCPHCGSRVSFDFPMTLHEKWMEYSKERYNELNEKVR